MMKLFYFWAIFYSAIHPLRLLREESTHITQTITPGSMELICELHYPKVVYYSHNLIELFIPEGLILL